MIGTWSRRWPAFESKLLGNTRGVWLYLPPGYEAHRTRYPVIYMHDGQNLFDPAAAFGGTPWRVGESLDSLRLGRVAPDCIVVGIENTAARLDEYSPVPEPRHGGGRAELYLRMLVEELKPFIDASLRTKPERAHTVMIGSSLGGLMTAFAGLRCADVFGRIGLLSPSSWWNAGWLARQVEASAGQVRPIRVYVDSGDAGQDQDDVETTRQLAEAYRRAGFVDGADFKHFIRPGHEHGERAWAERFPEAVRFLLGP